MAHSVISRIPTSEELAKKPFIGRRDLTIDSGGQIDPLSVIMLQQMIADSYTDARDIWEKNRARVRKEGDDPGLYGPNESQRKIEEWLMRTRFLPRPAIPEPQSATSEPQSIIAPKCEATEVPSRPSLRLRCVQMVTRRRFKSSRKRYAALLQKRPKIADELPRPMKQVAHSKAESRSEVSSTPTIRSTPHRRPLPAFPRIIPSTKPLLRRMTSVDSRALISCSVRTRRIRPRPVTDPIVPNIPLISSKNGVCTNTCAMSINVQSTSHSAPLCTIFNSDRRPPPLCITLSLVFLFQCCMLLCMIGILLLCFIKFCSAVIRFFFYGFQKMSNFRNHPSHPAFP